MAIVSYSINLNLDIAFSLYNYSVSRLGNKVIPASQNKLKTTPSSDSWKSLEMFVCMWVSMCVCMYVCVCVWYLSTVTLPCRFLMFLCLHTPELPWPQPLPYVHVLLEFCSAEITCNLYILWEHSRRSVLPLACQANFSLISPCFPCWTCEMQAYQPTVTSLWFLLCLFDWQTAYLRLTSSYLLFWSR